MNTKQIKNTNNCAIRLLETVVLASALLAVKWKNLQLFEINSGYLGYSEM